MNFLKRYNSYNEYDYEDQDEADYLMFKKLNWYLMDFYSFEYQLTINYQILETEY